MMALLRWIGRRTIHFFSEIGTMSILLFRIVANTRHAFRDRRLILDQMLPGRSGFLVLEKIRAIRAESGKPPVIMITANPGTRHKVYAETLGVDFYLNKPFRMEKLTNAAKDLLSK